MSETLHDDRLTDPNPYLGPMSEKARAMHKQALISGAEDALMKGREAMHVIGSPEFSAKLTIEHGHALSLSMRSLYRLASAGNWSGSLSLAIVLGGCS